MCVQSEKKILIFLFLLYSLVCAENPSLYFISKNYANIFSFFEKATKEKFIIKRAFDDDDIIYYLK